MHSPKTTLSTATVPLIAATCSKWGPLAGFSFFWFPFWARKGVFATRLGGRAATQCLFLSLVSRLRLGTIGAFCPAAPLAGSIRCVTLFYFTSPYFSTSHKWRALVIPSVAFPWTFVLIVHSWVYYLVKSWNNGWFL